MQLLRQPARSIIVSVLVLVSMLLASCGSSQQTASSGTQPVTLTWLMWSASTQEVQAWQYDASLVTKKYPWIHVKFETTTFSNYWTKLESEAASGSLPDIISLQSQHTPGFASSFRPLSSFIKQNNFDISAFNPVILKGLTYQGDLRALPYDFGPLVIFYNKTLFQQHHIPFPSNNWTYAQFLQDAQQLTQGNTYGYIDTPGIDAFLPFALSSGAQYLTTNGDLNLKNNAALADAFQDYAKPVYQYHVSPTVSVAEASNISFMWQAGNIGMVVDGPWDLINAKANAKFPFGIAPIPALSQGQTTVVAGSGFGISTTCQYPDDAWKAISVLTGPDAEQYLAANGRAFAARTAQQQYWYKNAVPGAETTLNYALAHSVPEITTDNWNEASTLFTQYGVKVFSGQQSAASALADIQDQASSS
jgi:ABC-type glycerol-3-phosphate transport system substrate-binding protein